MVFLFRIILNLLYCYELAGFDIFRKYWFNNYSGDQSIFIDVIVIASHTNKQKLSGDNRFWSRYLVGFCLIRSEDVLTNSANIGMIVHFMSGNFEIFELVCRSKRDNIEQNVCRRLFSWIFLLSLTNISAIPIFCTSGHPSMPVLHNTVCANFGDKRAE